MTRIGQLARVLVVEPDATLRLMLARVLEEHRYVVVGTGDLAMGRALLDAGLGIELVVTNLRLGLGGHAAWLDQLELAHPGIAILHLTGPVFQGRDPFGSAGFNVDRFLAAVRHCLATGKCDPPPDQRRAS